MSDLLGAFVTAKLLDKEDCRQGVVININPLIIRGQSGQEYKCEDNPVPVINPPEICIACGLALGRFCDGCEMKLNMLESVLAKNNLKLTQIEFN